MTENSSELVIASLRRRPQTLADLTLAFGEDTERVVRQLVEKGTLTTYRFAESEFYKVTSNED